MEASDAQPGAANSGRHRAPDGDAQTAFIPRITDASPNGVPGGPLDPPPALGQLEPPAALADMTSRTPPPAAPVSAADTAVLRTDTPAGAVDPVVARAAAAARAAARVEAPAAGVVSVAAAAVPPA